MPRRGSPSSIEISCCVGDGADPDAVDHGAEGGRVAGLRRLSRERLTDAVGERAHDTLEKQQSPAAEERLEVGSPLRVGEWIPDAFDDLIGDDVGQRAEGISQCSDQIEHVGDSDSRVGAIDHEGKESRTANEEMVPAVGLYQPNRLRFAQYGSRELRHARRQLLAGVPQRGLVQRGGTDLDPEQRGQVGAGLPRLDEVLDPSQRVSALLEATRPSGRVVEAAPRQLSDPPVSRQRVSYELSGAMTRGFAARIPRNVRATQVPLQRGSRRDGAAPAGLANVV